MALRLEVQETRLEPQYVPLVIILYCHKEKEISVVMSAN